MKTFNPKARIVVSLLMVLVMLFSTIAVTAFANTAEEGGNSTPAGTNSELTVADTDWYTFSYTPPKDGAAAKLDVQIKADVSEYLNIGKADVVALVYDVFEIALQYAMDSKIGSYVDLDSFDFMPLSASSYPSLDSLPAGVKEMIKDKAMEILGVDNLEDFENKLTVGGENGYTQEEVDAYKQNVQANIETFVKDTAAGSDGVAMIIGTVLDGTGATEQDIQKIVDTVEEVIVKPTETPDGKVVYTEKTIFTDIMEKIYGEEDENGEIVIPAESVSKVEDLTDTVTDVVDKAVNNEYSPEDLIGLFKAVSVDGKNVLYRDERNDIQFSTSAILAALKKIPMPGELANYDVEDYKSLLSYSFGVDFYVIGAFNLDISLGITGDEYQIGKIKSVMSIIASHVDIDFTRLAEGGKVTFKLLVPDEFAVLLNRAIKSDMIPDSIKHKIFTGLDANGNDVIKFISEDLTLEEIITVLQSIDYEKVIDKTLGKEIILKLAKKFHIDDNLERLTNEQIDAKLDEYAAELGECYNKAIKYVVKAADYVNEFCPKAMDKSIADFYKGNGTFNAVADATISEELLLKVVAKAASVADNHLSEEYDGKIASVKEILDFMISYVMNGRSFTVEADVTVKFLDIYQVTFVNGNNEVRGFLPVGADIAFFANNDSVAAWVDSDGNVYKTMPAKDVVLSPVGDLTAWVEYGEDVATEVGGQYKTEGYTLEAVIEYARAGKDGVTVKYQWYKGTTAVTELLEDNATYTVTNVSDSGDYWCKIVVEDSEAGNKEVDTAEVKVEITPAVITVSGVTWNYVTGETAFTYSGSKYTVTATPVVDANGNLVAVKEILGNEYTDAGQYVAKVSYKLNDESGNYTLECENTVEGYYVLNWSIAKAKITVAGYDVVWQISYVDGNDTVNIDPSTVTDNELPLVPGRTYTVTIALANASALDAKLVWTYTGSFTLSETNTSGSLPVEENEAFIAVHADYAANYELDSATYTAFRNYIEGITGTAWIVSGHIHNYTNSVKVSDATCISPATYKKQCSCGVFEQENGADKIYHQGGVDPNNHASELTNKNVSCTITTPGYDWTNWCASCGHKESEHVHTRTTVTEDGYTYLYCSVCGIVGDKVPVSTTVPEKSPAAGLTVKGEGADKFTASNVTDDYKDYKFPKGQFSKGKKGTVILAYDFEPNGATGEFTITFEIPTDYIAHKDLAIYHFADDGTLEQVSNITVKDGKVTFKASEFSVYALVAIEERSNWWVWLIVAFGALLVIGAVIAIIVVSKKRKAALLDEKDENASAPIAAETPETNEGETVDTTPSVGEAAIEVSELTSAQAESPVTDENAEDTAETEETEPVEEAPAEEVVEEAPVEEVVEEAPVEEVVEEAPVEEVVEEAPVEEVVEEAPVEEVVEEAPVEEVVEEAPVEEVVEEAPAEEVVEEAPAEKSATEEPIAAVTATPEIASEEDSILVNGEVVYVHYRSSFTSRLIQANDTIQNYYTTIKNYILSYTGVKAKASWNYEVFTKGRTQCVKLNVKGKALTLNIALDPKEYSVTKYHFTDLSDNPKFEATPMLLKVKSDRGLKYALELIAEAMKKLGIEQGEIPTVDYTMPYESNASLAKRGIVKVILPAGVKYDPNVEIREANVSEIIGGDVDKTVTREEVFLYDNDDVAEAEIEEAVAEEPVAAVEEPVAEAVAEEVIAEEDAVAVESQNTSAVMPVISSDDTITVEGNVVLIRYRSSFTSRLIQAASDVQDYYTALKNHLLSYKGIKCRTSWNYETFAKGRTQCARINIKGKTLTINLALLPESYNVNKYHFTDLSDNPKFDKLPMLLKIRSARALKYAMELIDELMKNLEVSVGKIQNVDYHKPYESNSELARRGLMKIILPAGVKLDETTILREENVDSMMDSHKQTDAPMTPAEEVVEETPVEEVVEEAPVEEVVEEAPVEEVVEETPVEEVVEEAPVEEVVEEAPVEKVIEEAPVEEVVEEAPVEEVVEEAPVEEVVEEAPAEEVVEEAPVEEPIFTDAQHADEMVNDEVAAHSIEVIKKSRSGKMVEVNIDDICANFEDGDVVTLEALKAKRLVNKAAGRVKVLAKGVMTKSLTVEADKFSLQAVKMITLAGGTAKRYN